MSCEHEDNICTACEAAFPEDEFCPVCEIQRRRTSLQWRPIETAPRDKRILLSDGESVWEGGWIPDDEWFTIGEITPTHWLPLPPPPEEKK